MGLIGLHTFVYALRAVVGIFSSSSSPTQADISHFRVHSLPDSPPLPPSWAGLVPVPDTEEGNALFFWLFEAEDSTYDENLIIWLNGGPGCSSLIGLTTGNGPLTFTNTATNFTSNPYSWSKLGHVLYIDQPVGTGFSTASEPYPATTQARVTSDFTKWLRSFLTDYFPHLRSKHIHLIGESYAGTYIPYFAQGLLDQKDIFPVDLRSISIGDGTIGNPRAMSAVSISAFLREQKHFLAIPDDILSAYAQADAICGFDKIMAQGNQFPPTAPIHLPSQIPTDPPQQPVSITTEEELLLCDIHPDTPSKILSSILNSSCYGPCATFSSAIDYLHAIYPEDNKQNKCPDIYDISATCTEPDPLDLQNIYFSRPDVQKALNLNFNNTHPSNSNNETTRPFHPCNMTILSILQAENPQPEPAAYALLPSLIDRAHLPVHIYSGDLDLLVNHVGTELVLQNMTWGGSQGFSEDFRKRDRAFYADDAGISAEAKERKCTGDMDTDVHMRTRTDTRMMKRRGSGNSRRSDDAGGAGCKDEEAGIWVSERGVTYHLFWGAGHSVFMKRPKEMFAYVRDVVVSK